MWSPTTSNTSSDNKQREEVEDCSCSGDSAQPQQQQQQQQKLNIFETNSKKPNLPFDVNLTSAAAAKAAQDTQERASQKEKELQDETVDSGFISGPQTNIFQDQDEDNEPSSVVATPTSPAASDASAAADVASVGDSHPAQKYNISVAPSVGEQQQQHKEALDSGCIDVEYLDEDETAYADHDEPIADSINEAFATTTAAAAASASQAQQEQKQVLTNEQQTSAAVSAAPLAVGSHSDQMILQHNVDAGMSEWFCNLSLQTEAAPRAQQQQPQQQQQQQPMTGINNLDGGGRRVFTTSASAAAILIDGKSINAHNLYKQPQPQQQQPAAGPTPAPATNLTPSNAWEQFYQQNDDGDTPLHLACISGYADVVAALIRMAPHPCLFNIQNDEAQTPLHLAALTAQPKILRMLLIAGAEPTIRDRRGNTALHLACNAGDEQCVRALTIEISASEIHEAHRQYGHRSNDKTVSYLSYALLPSDLEIRNYDGERCVHLAAQAGHIDILRILVLYGADINAREGKSGRTPLHIAIECCNEDLANFLLDECQKLNLETATYAGLTAYQVACVLNKSQMQNILERRGAEPLTPPDSDYDSSDIEDLDDSKIYDRFGDPGYFVNYNGGSPMTVA